MALVAAALTTMSLATALSGYLGRIVNWPWRLILVAAVLPSLTAAALPVKLAGGLPFLALLAWHLVLARRTVDAESVPIAGR